MSTLAESADGGEYTFSIIDHIVHKDLFLARLVKSCPK